MYFKLVENATDAESARRDCKKDGAQLPIIKSEADLAMASFLAGKSHRHSKFESVVIPNSKILSQTTHAEKNKIFI